jgi:hypothetical protein
MQWLVGSDTGLDGLKLEQMKHQMKKLQVIGEEEEVRTVAGLHSVEEEMNQGVMYEDGYEYFMHPPGKPATNITRETVRYFKAFQRTWGFYANRVIIPVMMKGTLYGFAAIDILGKKEWLRQHPTEDEKDYRKVRYPRHMKTGSCLFGYDNVTKGTERVIITEGCREVMKVWQEGFPDCVAQLGSRFTVQNDSCVSDDHLKLLSEFGCRNVVLMYDNDPAGREMTRLIGEELKRIFTVYDALVPKGRDPKTLCGKELKAVLRAAKKMK